MLQIPNISNGEWQIIEVLWRQSPLTAAKIVDEIQKTKDCSPRTIKTLLRRLIAKGAVNYKVDEKDCRIYHYSPIISEEDCLHKVNEEFLNIHYNGDLTVLLEKLMDQYELTDNMRNCIVNKLGILTK